MTSLTFVARDAFYSMTDATVNRASSEHFQLIWGNSGNSLVSSEFIANQLNILENVRAYYVNELKLRDGSQSTITSLRDGKRYKTNVYLTNTGLSQHAQGYAVMSGDRESFGIIIMDPVAFRGDGGAAPHEYGHVLTMHQCENNDGGWCNNASIGSWWESLANWLAEMYRKSEYYSAKGQTLPPSTSYYLPRMMHFCMHKTHGRDYYHNWSFFDYLYENPDNLPDLGKDFIVKLLQESRRNENFFEMIQRLAPQVDMKAFIGNDARRVVASDYQYGYLHKPILQQALKDPIQYHRIATELQSVPDREGWWRPVVEHAPQVYGSNMIPLTQTSSRVSVEFNGLADAIFGSDWRASIVAIGADEKARYSSLWRQGVNSLDVTPQDKVYLVVSATPDKLYDINAFVNDEMAPYASSPLRARYPYEVKLTGAQPLIKGRERVTSVPSRRHANGGGFVANTAQVAETAYVGPNAAVLNGATVSDNARIEDFALVSGNARVSQSAVVKGYGLVTANATLTGNAVVSDYGVATESAMLAGSARVTQHAIAAGTTNMLGNSAARGSAYLYGDAVLEGTAVVDGDYSNTLKLNKGNVFGWLVSQQIADKRPYSEGVVLAYDFSNGSETQGAIWAMDTYGASHGLIRGAATISNNMLRLNGRDQYVLVDNRIFDLASAKIDMDLVWDGGGNQFLWSLGSNPQTQLSLEVLNTAGDLSLTLNYGGEVSKVNAGKLTVGGLTKLRVTVADARLILSVNGIDVGSQNIPIRNLGLLRTSNTYDANSAAYIGRGLSSDSPLFRGAIDRFAISY